MLGLWLLASLNCVCDAFAATAVFLANACTTGAIESEAHEPIRRVAYVYFVNHHVENVLARCVQFVFDGIKTVGERFHSARWLRA